MYAIKLCQKQLWRNLASMNLKLKKLNFLLRVRPKFSSLAFLTYILQYVVKKTDNMLSRLLLKPNDFMITHNPWGYWRIGNNLESILSVFLKSFSWKFLIEYGLRQDSMLNVLIFIMVLEALSRYISSGCPELLYDHDCALVGHLSAWKWN